MPTEGGKGGVVTVLCRWGRIATKIEKELEDLANDLMVDLQFEK